MSAHCTYAGFASSLAVRSLITAKIRLLYFQVSWQKDRFDISTEWKPILSKKKVALRNVKFHVAGLDTDIKRCRCYFVVPRSALR